METQGDPRVVWAERVDDGVIITFDDGNCAYYSAILLHATFPQAQAVTESEDEE